MNMNSDFTEINTQTIASRIPLIRETLGMSQKDFAAKIAVAPSNLSEIESGKSKPGLKFLLKVISAFSINANWLLWGLGQVFLADEEKNKYSNFEFGEQTEDIRKLLSRFKESPLLKITVMSFAGKFQLEHEEVIRKDIESRKTTQMEGTGRE